MEDEGDMFMLMHPRLDPGSTVLNILEPLTALARDPDEDYNSITIVPPGRDKGMYELLSSMTGEN